MDKLNHTILCEMLVHISLCTHKNPKKVLCVNSNSDTKNDFDNEFKKHNISITYSNSLDAVGIYDVIIFAKKINNNFDIEQLHKKLGIDGVFVGLSENYSHNKENLKNNLKTIGKDFWISMPFFFSSFCAILTSKVYHPQADLILQRSDMLDDLKYYNSEIHNSSFVLPTFIKQDLSSVCKF